MINKFSKQSIKMLSSPISLVVAALLISVCGYAYEVFHMEGTTTASKFSFAAYIPFIMWGVYFYLFVSKLISAKIKRSSRVNAVVLLSLWWIMGAWVGYMLSLSAAFVLFYVATHIQYMAWIPVSLSINPICYSTAVFASIFAFPLMVLFYLYEA